MFYLWTYLGLDWEQSTSRPSRWLFPQRTRNHLPRTILLTSDVPRCWLDLDMLKREECMLSMRIIQILVTDIPKTRLASLRWDSVLSRKYCSTSFTSLSGIPLLDTLSSCLAFPPVDSKCFINLPNAFLEGTGLWLVGWKCNLNVRLTKEMFFNSP